MSGPWPKAAARELCDEIFGPAPRTRVARDAARVAKVLAENEPDVLQRLYDDARDELDLPYLNNAAFTHRLDTVSAVANELRYRLDCGALSEEQVENRYSDVLAATIHLT